MLLALLLLVQSPVTVQLNHDQFRAGERARVYVQSAQDGYLVVLHADAAGRVRVLFPLDPSDDDFVRGGKKFEVRGRNNRDAFQIESSDGSGTVIAAVAPDAFNFGAFVRNDHWDFAALGAPSSTVQNDPLARLLDIVRQISADSAARFDYDDATYVVTSGAIASHYGYGSGWVYPRHFGYYDPFCYDPFFFGLSARCYGFGYGFGFRGFGIGYRFPVYRPFGFSRPFVFNSGGRGVGRFVIPSRPTRFAPIQVRPRAPAPVRAPQFTGPSRSRAQPRSAPRMSGGSRGGGGRRH